MMGIVGAFEFEGRRVRTWRRGDAIWLCAPDVSAAFSSFRDKLITLSDRDTIKVRVEDQHGARVAKFVSLSAIDDVFARSRAPKAAAFRVAVMAAAQEAA